MANKKIPYDVAPISRDYSTPAARRSSPSKSRLSASLFILAILIFNIVLGVVTISSIASNRASNVLNVTNNVVVNGSDVAYASGKAKLSSVCVAIDSTANYSRTHLPNYRQFFVNTTERGAGTIYKIDKTAGEAYIITCNHVVTRATNNVFVLLYDSDTPVYATVVGTSVNYDVAVLKVEDDQIKNTMCTAATVADSAFIAEGEMAIAVGNPLSAGFNVSAGVISKPLATYTTNSIEKKGIQIDTAVNSGNSGGGLFDKNGNFIGIVQAKNDASTTDNIAFAVPGNIAVTIADNLIDGRSLAYCVYGFSISASPYVKLVEGQYYKFYKVYANSVSGSDAIASGLKSGDQIVSISYRGKTKQIVSDFSLDEIKFDIVAGDRLELVVVRGTETIVLGMTITADSMST